MFLSHARLSAVYKDGMRRNGMLLCAVPNCPRRVEGKIRVKKARGGFKTLPRHICRECVERIRAKYGVE